MKYVKLVVLMLLPLSVYATGGKKDDGGDSGAVATAESVAVAGAKAYASGGVAEASGGDAVSSATIESGAVLTKAVVGDVSGGSAAGGDASGQTVSVDTDVPRQAPGVGLVAPVKAGYKCLGWGGSNETGSTVLGYCWKQRDEWSLERAEYLAGLGLSVEAASAYCSKRVHRKAFDGDCEAVMSRAYAVRYQPRPAIHMRIDPQQACEERAIGETTIKEIVDDGTTLYYECAQLPDGK